MQQLMIAQGKKHQQQKLNCKHHQTMHSNSSSCSLPQAGGSVAGSRSMLLLLVVVLVRHWSQQLQHVGQPSGIAWSSTCLPLLVLSKHQQQQQQQSRSLEHLLQEW
jgi:hypothetical protein